MKCSTCNGGGEVFGVISMTNATCDIETCRDCKGTGQINTVGQLVDALKIAERKSRVNLCRYKSAKHKLDTHKETRRELAQCKREKRLGLKLARGMG